MILTDQQTAALEMVKKNNLSLLIGFPGTGKTTITQESDMGEEVLKASDRLS